MRIFREHFWKLNLGGLCDARLSGRVYDARLQSSVPVDLATLPVPEAASEPPSVIVDAFDRFEHLWDQPVLRARRTLENCGMSIIGGTPLISRLPFTFICLACHVFRVEPSYGRACSWKFLHILAAALQT